MLIQLQDLSKFIGGRALFEHASLRLNAGDRVGLVGPNGAGKTTMLRIVAGDEASDHGEVLKSRGTRIGMLRQEIDPTQEHSVQQEAAKALARLDDLEAEMRDLEHQMSDLGDEHVEVPAAMAERYDRISAQFTHGGGYEREGRIAAVLAGLGFEESERHRPLSSFSGGWLMRVELAKLFLSDPDVLLLDEPTNHLDLPAIQWFEETVAAFEGAVIVVSHDRTFLRRHTTRVAEIDGTGRFTVYEGNYDRYLELREEQREHLLARKQNQDREIAQMERFVERFRAKATKARQAQSRVKALAKIDRIELAPDTRRQMRMKIPDPPRAGAVVMNLSQVHKSYAEKKVYEGIDFQVRRGDRVALAGPNGAGKSTLLRIVAGRLEINAGERRPGHNVEVAFFAQHQLESLRPELNVLEELERGAQTDDYPRLRGHLGAFLFSGDDVEKKISVLSGGEKARVALAKMLLRPANLLVLDEPTNHLDIASREVLEQALASFQGTLVFVSHDRSFINALATRVVEVNHGVLTEYIGNYDEFLARKTALEKRQATQDAAAAQEPQTASKPAPKSTSKPSRSEPKLSKKERAALRERRKAHDKVQRQIQRLEEKIQQQEALLEPFGWQLSDPGIASDAARLQELEAQRAAVQQVIDDFYRDWERLADELSALADGLS
ncbi:MAG: ABC-F family ATP-binding cassette domain-containing protein [Deltaproteobacteria bacterium]|nr:ABC-F family ATP-binding cassette domain-containing protein [Deltaproteobacteria bacterium]